MSHGEDDSIEFEHSTNALSASASASGKRLLVLNITGNPGLIGYYRTFLALIYKGLRAKYDDDCAVRVCGVSLAGFELLSAQSNARDVMGTRGPYDLEQQIQYIDRVLDRYCRREEGEAAASASAVQEPLRVVLLGHSVGSYILLEVLRRRKLRARQAGTGDYGGPKIIAGICLFPTVTHIAKSQSGKRFSSFFAIPYFPIIASIFVHVLFAWVPLGVLQKLVGVVTGFPDDAARTTAAFIQSRGGVRQALYLARDEMQTIKADRWDDELWGVSKADASTTADKTKLFFYFGTNDHWVANETRDELMAARAPVGSQTGKDGPVMEIDDTGLPHGFCIKHNEAVARKVLEYVDKAVMENW